MTKPLKIVVGLAVALLALIVILIVGLALGLARRPAEMVASRLMERPVSIEELKVYVLRMTPVAQVKGLKIANTEWAARQGKDGVPQMVDIGRGDIAVRLMPLLTGEVRFARLSLDNAQIDLVREADGRANWAMGASKATSDTAPLVLPVIEQFVVKNSRIKLNDALTKIAFEGDFDTQEDGSVEGGEPFALTGKGTLNTQPFSLQLTGGGIASVIAGGAYPFNLEVNHGPTRITAKGNLTDPLNFGDFTAKMTLEGKNLADLYYLTGLALPITRAYSLSGDLSRVGAVYELNKLTGKLGGSDLHGDVRVDISGERVMLMADLRSKLLDPKDAGVLFGGEAESQYLLPDSPLDLTRLRSMDAEVRYKAEAINVDTLPLKQVALVMTLDHGTLTLAPLTLILPQGTVSGSLVIDGSKEVPALAADMRLVGTRLEDFAAQAGQPGAISGALLARVKLAGSGMSIHKAAGNADGTAAIVIPNGQIRQAFAELLGVSAVKGLGLLLTGDKTQTEIRCGVASFEAKNGLLQAQHVTVDTDVVKVNGKGHVNLKDESMDLTLKGEPKEVRLVRLLVPLKIGGTLKSPEVGVNALPLGIQAGAATALGIVITPLVAILPFVDAGLTKDANCAALMQGAKDAGVQGATRGAR